MPAVTITIDDLAPFASIEETKAQAMIDDTMATAVLEAPCIATEDFEHAAAAKAIIRGAILRWNDAGSGALSQEQVGPWSQTIDNRTQRHAMFTRDEMDRLKKLCQTDSSAFSIDTVTCGAIHADTCSINFGAEYCSCGADIAGFPLYG